MARKSPNPKQVRSASTRFAIYTRKFSEDGLEQEFNSLDAQRVACLAYTTSQRHEGWKALPTYYDDGGFSGGTLVRPAVQQLLADIRAGRVDLVVIYKVDRLTRSLADFAKLVEIFDAHGVSFVSITQHFNTTTSIGRLTLNMLLSFAQFEREVTLRVIQSFQNHQIRPTGVVAYLRSGPRGVDEVYQGFIGGRLVEYLDAKRSRPGGYCGRRRTCDQQNWYDCAISTQSSGQFQAGHVRHVMVQD